MHLLLKYSLSIYTEILISTFIKGNMYTVFKIYIYHRIFWYFFLHDLNDMSILMSCFILIAVIYCKGADLFVVVSSPEPIMSYNDHSSSIVRRRPFVVVRPSVVRLHLWRI